MVITQWRMESNLLSHPHKYGPGIPRHRDSVQGEVLEHVMPCSMTNDPCLPGTEGFLRMQGFQAEKVPGKQEAGRPSYLKSGSHETSCLKTYPSYPH